MTSPFKKTMVFLGLAEEEAQVQESAAQPQQVAHKELAPRKQTQQAEPRQAKVTPLRQVAPLRPQSAGPLSEILTLHPQEYSEARTIAENFREGVPIIMNLSHMNETDAKRIIDFASGLVMGLNGHIERVTGKVFLLAPEHVDPRSEEDLFEAEEVADESSDGSFFIQ